MWRAAVLLSGVTGLLLPSAGFSQGQAKTVTIEVHLPEKAKLYIEGRETTSTGPVRLFFSPPLPPGKYTYTLKAVIPDRNGPRVVTRKLDIRPGDFESVDLRLAGKERIPDVEYEPTPQKVVAAMLRMARLTKKDVLWDLGCGDARIPVTAAKEYGCKARGFDIDPARIRDSLANIKKNGVANLVSVEQKDIFTLDLSKEPTVVMLYLLPRLNAKLLPQLRKLPAGARIVSNTHRLADIRPDERMTVDTDQGEFTLFMWKVETIKGD